MDPNRAEKSNSNHGSLRIFGDFWFYTSGKGWICICYIYIKMREEQRKEALVSFINAVLTNNININRICIFFRQKFLPWTPVPIFVLKRFETNLLHNERTGIWCGKRVTQAKNLSEQRNTVFFFRSKAGHSKQRREPTNCTYIWSRVPNQTWSTLV